MILQLMLLLSQEPITIPSPPITAFEQTKDLEKTEMYCLHDTTESVDSNYVAAHSDLPIGSKVLIVGEDGDFYITHQMTYIPKEMLTEHEEDIWYPMEPETKYCAQDLPDFTFNEELQLVAANSKEQFRTSDGRVIDSSELMDEKYIEPEPVVISVSTPAPQATSYSYPTGNVLTPSAGVIIDDWGHRETYYNLNMSGVLSIMAGYGYTDYAVRADGVKTLNGYVMVAANLALYPRGSLIETSLGTGLVCDTGGFVATYPNGLDIAVAW